MRVAIPRRSSTEAARDGTASHAIAAAYIEDLCNGKEIPVQPEIDDDEIREAALIYADDVINESATRNVSPYVETHLHVPRVHELSHGICDAYLLDSDSHTLIVWDYKYGHAPVDVYENWQLINYVAGVLDSHSINGAAEQQLTVDMRIIQPRAYRRDGPIQKWVTTAADLRGYINILHDNAHIAMSDTAQFQTGAHCRHCPGRYACPAALKAGTALFEVASDPLPDEPSTEAIATQLAIVTRARRALQYLEVSYEEQVHIRIERGESIPGWALVPKTGREAWTKAADEIVAMGDMMGLDLRKNGTITPVQARNAGLPADIVSAYSHRTTSGAKLVAADTKTARRIFKNAN